MATPIRRYHLGLSFELWRSRESWFWKIAKPCHEAGTIGAAATEDEAASEAHASIEEVSTCCGKSAAGSNRSAAAGHNVFLSK